MNALRKLALVALALVLAGTGCVQDAADDCCQGEAVTVNVENNVTVNVSVQVTDHGTYITEGDVITFVNNEGDEYVLNVSDDDNTYYYYDNDTVVIVPPPPPPPEPEEPTEPEEPPVEPPVEPEPEIGIFYLEGKPTTVVMQSPDCDQPSWMDVPYGKLKIVLSSEMTPFTACWAATDRLDDQWVFKAHLEASPEGSLGKYLNGCSGTYLPEEQALKDVLSGGVCYEHVGNGATHWYYNGAFGVVCVQITHNPGP